MSRTYSPLPAPGLHASVDFHKPATGDTRPVTLDDAATAVMTEFRKVRALTIHGAATMERAYDKMITNWVRLLLVVDSRNRVVGLSKSTDVEGEKPLRIIQDRRIRRAEILVPDVIAAGAARSARHGRRAVRSRGPRRGNPESGGTPPRPGGGLGRKGNQTVRGLFSCSQLEKQLGQDIETTEIARSFAEVGNLPVPRSSMDTPAWPTFPAAIPAASLVELPRCWNCRPGRSTIGA